MVYYSYWPLNPDHELIIWSSRNFHQRAVCQIWVKGKLKKDGWGPEGKNRNGKKKQSRLYSCLNWGKRIWQPELHSAMPHKVRREGMLHTMQGNRKESRKEEKHIQIDMLHWTLEAQIHLHARDETVQLPPGIEKRKEVRKEWRVQSLGLILPG